MSGPSQYGPPWILKSFECIWPYLILAIIGRLSPLRSTSGRFFHGTLYSCKRIKHYLRNDPLVSVASVASVASSIVSSTVASPVESESLGFKYEVQYVCPSSGLKVVTAVWQKVAFTVRCFYICDIFSSTDYGREYKFFFWKLRLKCFHIFLKKKHLSVRYHYP